MQTLIMRLYDKSMYKDEGMGWYKEAHQYAQNLANRFSKSIDITAGIISALSPSVSWERNKEDAKNLLQQGSKAIVSTYGMNKRKALDIIATGESLPYFMKPQSSFKTLNFYKNILEPKNPEFVTIDRQMLRILNLTPQAINTRPRYMRLKDMFIAVAIKLDIIPNQLQASLWLAEKYKDKVDVGF